MKGEFVRLRLCLILLLLGYDGLVTSFTQDDYKKECLSGEYNFDKVIHNEYDLVDGLNLKDYLSKIDGIPQSDRDKIKELVLNLNDTINYQDIVKFGWTFVITYVVYFVLAGIVLISFIIMLCCCCRPCLCCRSVRKEKKNSFCFNMSLVIGGLLVAGIVAASVFGFSQFPKLIDSHQSAKCGVLQLFSNFQNGEIKETKPEWTGFNNIQNTLSKFSDLIDQIVTQSKSAFKDLDYADKAQDEYNNLLSASYDNQKDKLTKSPNPANSQVSPVFIKTYGPLSSSQAAIYAFSQELNIITSLYSSKVKDLQSQTSKISENVDQAKEVLNDFKRGINPLNNIISNVDKDVDKFKEIVMIYIKCNFRTTVTSAVSRLLTPQFLLWPLLLLCLF